MLKLAVPLLQFAEPLFGGTFAVFAGSPVKEAECWYDRHVGEPPSESRVTTLRIAARFYFHPRHIGGMFWFKDRHPEPDFVAHEAIHAALWVMKCRGVEPVAADDDETLASYVEFLVRSMKDVLRGKRK